jgi:hypothetical protein
VTALAQTIRASQDEVQLAWSIYRTLLIAEADDPHLQDSPDHQRSIAVARFRFQTMYDDWAAQ